MIVYSKLLSHCLFNAFKFPTKNPSFLVFKPLKKKTKKEAFRRERKAFSGRRKKTEK